MKKYLILILLALFILSPVSLSTSSFAQSDNDTSDPSGETEGDVVIYN